MIKNDKAFDKIPGSKEYLTSILLDKLKEQSGSDGMQNEDDTQQSRGVK